MPHEHPPTWKHRKRETALILLLLLTGCKHEECQSIDDKELYHKIFQQCLETVAKQPENNHEDNNGHLVNACNDVARAQSPQWVCKEVEGFGL